MKSGCPVGLSEAPALADNGDAKVKRFLYAALILAGMLACWYAGRESHIRQEIPNVAARPADVQEPKADLLETEDGRRHLAAVLALTDLYRDCLGRKLTKKEIASLEHADYWDIQNTMKGLAFTDEQRGCQGRALQDCERRWPGYCEAQPNE